jgi:hypothetical protein
VHETRVADDIRYQKRRQPLLDEFTGQAVPRIRNSSANLEFHQSASVRKAEVSPI